MSQINCLLFAELREWLGCDSLAMSFVERESVGTLIERLIESHGERFLVLREEHVKVAINSALSCSQDTLSENAEVAFFPPVTGG